MRRALVIVDVQPKFGSARCPKLIKEIVDLIKKARQRNDPIVVLEFLGWGPTDWRIIKSLSKYEGYRIATKDIRDGSAEVGWAVKGQHIDRFILCGVQTACCVMATAEGLVRAHPEASILIPLKACRDSEEPEAVTQLKSIADGRSLIVK